MMDWGEIRQAIADERGFYCEICNVRPWTDLHHCLIHGMKDIPQLDAPINLQAVCRTCHMTVANGKENRDNFAMAQRRRGYNVSRWLDILPLKVKPRI